MIAPSANVDRLFPTPLPSALPPVPSLELSLLPSSIRQWVYEHADSLQVPVEFVGVPAVIAMSGCIGRRIAVRLKRNISWYEVPILWGVIVGRPSAGKSPAISPARRMLDTLESEARQSYVEARGVHERMAQISEIEAQIALKSVRKLVSQGDRGAAEGALAAATREERECPREPRLVVNDATTEKLGELLGDNPRGLIYVRDEVAGWLANLDREGREGDRAFFLECWNGKGSFDFDRISRGTTRIEACAVSIMGGVQPGKLAEYVRGSIKDGAADDGLIQRFQMSIYPDLSPVWRFRDFAPALGIRPAPQSLRRMWLASAATCTMATRRTARIASASMRRAPLDACRAARRGCGPRTGGRRVLCVRRTGSGCRLMVHCAVRPHDRATRHDHG
ncbi:MAG: DUF3987 domain-containing protein [Xanthomonadales bacterium]|nr:DUF3987 domain-containing protein [Xanthomonadales bacterium]MDL1868490.1 DUF3987 domain-containing protein [Gammaproteobacteria bacterium PRO6]